MTEKQLYLLARPLGYAIAWKYNCLYSAENLTVNQWKYILYTKIVVARYCLRNQ